MPCSTRLRKNASVVNVASSVGKANAAAQRPQLVPLCNADCALFTMHVDVGSKQSMCASLGLNPASSMPEPQSHEQ